MRRCFLGMAVALVLFLLTAAVYGADAPDVFAGEWQGTIQIPGQPLKIEVRLSVEEAQLRGEIDIPAQGAHNIRLKDVTATDSSLSFVLADIPGDPGIEAVLTADGSTLEGSFRQAGMSFPVALQRVEPGELSQGERSSDEIKQDLRAFVQQTLAEWKVPGAAIGIVHEGEIFLAEGFGFRNAAEGLPVTSNTLFAIGSSTKAFTAASIALLVDEGKLNWDTPVADYLPWFRLEDAEASRQVTLRDLANHRSGLPRHDLAWYGSTNSREELIRNMRYLQPSMGFRQQFQYNNFGYTTLGFIAGQAAGMEWEELVQQRIFDVLGMKRTNFSVAVSQQQSDFAVPYKVENDNIIPVDFYQFGGMEPAGAINSSVQDMLLWVKLFLDGGRFGDNTVLSSSAVAEMAFRPQVALPVQGYPEIRFSNYAMGWIVEDYRGEVFTHHGGNIDGFSAAVAMVPQHDLGIVVLTNLNNTPVPYIISYRIMDELLGYSPVDWNSRIKATYAQMPEDLISPPRQIEGTTPSRALSEFVGHYRHPAYGTVIVTMSEDGQSLQMEYKGIVVPLEHWHYDVFAARFTGFAVPAHVPVQFLSGIDGHIQMLQIPWEASTEPIRFAVTADPGVLREDLLARFAGVYEVMGIRLTIRVQNGVLIMDVAGQGNIVLSPERGLRFVAEDMPGGSVEFIEQNGEITGIYLNQPNGTFEGSKVSSAE